MYKREEDIKLYKKRLTPYAMLFVNKTNNTSVLYYGQNV